MRLVFVDTGGPIAGDIDCLREGRSRHEHGSNHNQGTEGFDRHTTPLDGGNYGQ
jgi:hypothetical protein